MKKVLVLFVFALAFTITTSANQIKQAMIGSTAPAFKIQAIDGKSLALSDLRGKVVVLHFGAGW
jgi:cytochrome oxidase Cu insertion factor (SCO1/SenC/PrrC family)